MKYKYSIFGNETRHHIPHVHLFVSDGRQIILSLPDFEIMHGKLTSKELKQIKDDLISKTNALIDDFYAKNPDKKR